MENGTDPHPAPTDAAAEVARLEAEFPAWQIWTVLCWGSGRMWCCRRWDETDLTKTLTADSAEHLAEYIAGWAEDHAEAPQAGQLAAVRQDWADRFELGWDGRMFHARNRDGGPPLSHHTAEGIVRLMAEDIASRPGR